MIDELKKQVAREFGTPAVVVDLDKVERNIARVQGICDQAGVLNRPHIKTHKSAVIATMQRKAGAHGITCQKLGEAEVMAAAGHDNILISYNILGDEKIERLARLLSQTSVTVSCDNEVVAAGLAKAAAGANRTLSVLVECDTGRKRAGVTHVSEVLTLARSIEATEGLSFGGLLMYPPETAIQETNAFVETAVRELKAIGLQPGIVSNGGTPNLNNLEMMHGFTEHRPGTYVYNDRHTVASGAAFLDDCAVTVFSTVVSRAEKDRGVVDAGSKMLTSDLGGLGDGHGIVLEYPEARMPRLMEEHGFLSLPEARGPAIGEIVRILPNHVCVVINMVDEIVTVRDGRVVGAMKVDARGLTR